MIVYREASEISSFVFEEKKQAYKLDHFFLFNWKNSSVSISVVQSFKWKSWTCDIPVSFLVNWYKLAFKGCMSVLAWATMWWINKWAYAS